MAFLKQASLKIEKSEIKIDSWLNKGTIKTASDKIVDFKKIISDFNPNDYLLTHCTIIASVEVEDAPKPVHFTSEKTRKEFEKLEGCKDYYITPETTKYINSNGDAWSKQLLKQSYKTFIGSENYVEHVQDPKLSKGKILDAALREVDGGKSLFVDILVATNKKHDDLVRKITSGKLTTLSMGAVVGFTICTECGRVATDSTELCDHIQYLKRNSFISENDGKKRSVAELCGHYLYPDSNKFIEGSWVETPAFKGAVLRNELEIESIDKQSFIEKYEPIMNIQSMELKDIAQRVISACLLIDKVKKVFAKNEETPPEETPPEETPEETSEPVPEELKELGEPPESDALPAPMEEDVGDDKLEKVEKVPYDVLKKQLKENLMNQIKKELVEEMGLKPEDFKNTLEDVNLNDSIIQSNLVKKVKKAKELIRKEGVSSLLKNGYSSSDILKIAYISKEYSINMDVFKVINALNIKDFPSFRRYTKAIESKLNRELKILEKVEINKLAKKWLV